MSFFTRLLQWPEDSKGNNENQPTKEENKLNSDKKSKKNHDRQLAINKVNVNTVYNKMEDYEPVKNTTLIKQASKSHQDGKNVLKFRRLLEDEEMIDLETLKKNAWQGIPIEVRPIVWKLLLKYAPLHKNIRDSTIARKRKDYKGFVDMYYTDTKDSGLNDNEQKIMKIIINDVHRTQPNYRLFHNKLMQESMIRILWVWQVRHPASGYVQGMNDLITPFLIVFLMEHIGNINFDVIDVPEGFEDNFTEEVREMVEADTFWCLSKILDGILDNFTFKQGTEKAMAKIKDIIKKIDLELYNHLENVDPSQYIFNVFSLRWLFSLLIREFPLRVAIRLFDTYNSDENGFSVLHLYVCSAILLKWSIKLQKMNLDSIMIFLQDLPTKQWSEQDLEVILAEAYVFKSLYETTSG